MGVNEAAEEKFRARLAYCLTQWKRPHGGDIPQSEEGIAEHMRLVEDYETIYGPARPDSLKQYAAVYASIRMGLEADDTASEAAEAMRRQETARKEQEAVDARIRQREMLERQSRDEAHRILSMNSQSIPLLQLQVERLAAYVARDAARAEQLQGMLDSERYARSPLRREIRGNLADVQERLTEYRARLAKFEQDVADAEAENDWARDILGMEERTEAIEPSPLTIRWRRKSNGFYHPYGREDRAMLAEAGYRRPMGDGMVVTPDGRVKAWPDTARTSVTINGVDLDFTDVGAVLQDQLSAEELKKFVG